MSLVFYTFECLCDKRLTVAHLSFLWLWLDLVLDTLVSMLSETHWVLLPVMLVGEVDELSLRFVIVICYVSCVKILMWLIEWLVVWCETTYLFWTLFLMWILWKLSYGLYNMVGSHQLLWKMARLDSYNIVCGNVTVSPWRSLLINGCHYKFVASPSLCIFLSYCWFSDGDVTCSVVLHDNLMYVFITEIIGDSNPISSFKRLRVYWLRWSGQCNLALDLGGFSV